MFHRHKWKTLEYFYMPPKPNIEVERASQEFSFALVWGWTEVLAECTKCGLPKRWKVGNGDLRPESAKKK